MKKVLALVASTMMLVVGGLFVSCSDDGTKDVYDISRAGWSYAGKFSGTAVSDDEDVTYKVNEAIPGCVNWKEIKGNTKTYELEWYVRVSSRYYSDDKIPFEVSITKVGNEYYNLVNGEKVAFSSGSPESSSFTISAIAVGDVTFSNLSFTRVK